MQSSRRYIKRVWRVPKDRGALSYFSALLVKSLVKHGWPAVSQLNENYNSVIIRHIDGSDLLPSDFQAALEIAVRILARTYRIEVTQWENTVTLDHFYRVGAGGHFIKDKAL